MENAKIKNSVLAICFFCVIVEKQGLIHLKKIKIRYKIFPIFISN